jgi:hypothetical protein
MIGLRTKVLELVVPIAAFWGLVVLLAPLYGFVLFGGGIILTLYITQAFESNVQKETHVSL